MLSNTKSIIWGTGSVGKSGPTSGVVQSDASGNLSASTTINSSITVQGLSVGSNGGITAWASIQSTAGSIYANNGSIYAGSTSTDSVIRVGADNTNCSKMTYSTISTCGSMTADNYNATSDIRFKENIKDYPTDKMMRVLDLAVHTFNFIGKEKVDQVGLIAQEVQTVLGSDSHLLVDESDPDCLKIKESKIVYFLLGIIKSMDGRLTEMEERLTKAGL